MTHPTDNLLRAAAWDRAASIGEDADGRTMFGHFAVFNDWTEIDSTYEGRFLERIMPGAFADTFDAKGDSIRVLYDHGRDPQIGNKPLGQVLALREDERGAAYEVSLFDTGYVNELLPALQAGQLGASFRFRVVDEQWSTPSRSTTHNPERLEERSITRLELFEFGPVTFPAYASATAGLRSRTDEFLDALNDPMFVARFTERVGIDVAERVIASLPAADGPAQNQPTSSAAADGPDVTVTPTIPRATTLTAQALSDLTKRRRP